MKMQLKIQRISDNNCNNYSLDIKKIRVLNEINKNNILHLLLLCYILYNTILVFLLYI